jgi:SAM-dependent methyltransferase
MCGSGRFLVPLLERGVDITGVDASPFMLEACQRHSAERGTEAVLYQQALQELDVPRRFGFALIPAGSFGLITDPADAAEALRRLFRHLFPEGKLVLEIETPNARPSSPGKWHEFRQPRPDGTELVFQALPAYDADQHLQVDAHVYSIVRDGQIVESEAEELSIRFYEPERFAGMLAEAGFSAIRTTRAYSEDPPREDDAAVIFECRKPSRSVSEG